MADDQQPARHAVAEGLMLTGLGAVVVGAFLPWINSGLVSRDSFETLRSAERLGVVEARWQQLFLDLWYLLPLLAGVAVMAYLLERHRLATGLIATLGGAAATIALMVLLSPADKSSGGLVVLVGGVAALGGALWLIVLGRRDS